MNPENLPPKFSVIIPVLNEEMYIGDLLDCLADQTFIDFEIFIVDGGSKDGTERVVREHSDGLNIKFVHSPKKGVSFQRNFGAALSHSQNLLFMDADLYFKEDFLQKVYEYIITHDGIDILSTWLIPNSDKRIYKLAFKIYNHATNVAKHWIPVAVGAFMFCKKSVFEQLHGFDETVSVAEDYDLVIRAHKKKFKFELLRDPQVYFSVRRIEKMGKTRYVLTSGKFALYFPLRSIFKRVDIVNYWKMDNDVDDSWKKSSVNKFVPKDIK